MISGEDELYTGQKQMKENLVSLPLCQSSTWPVGVGGDPVWHVEAGDEPSEERPRARNTNALLQEIPGFMMDRSWQPRKKGKTNKKQALCLTFTEFERSLVEPWEFSSKVTVLVIPSSPQSIMRPEYTEYKLPLGSIYMQWLERRHGKKRTPDWKVK